MPTLPLTALCPSMTSQPCSRHSKCCSSFDDAGHFFAALAANINNISARGFVTPTVHHVMQTLLLPSDIPFLVLPGALIVSGFGTQGEGFIAVKHHGGLACWSLACCCSLARSCCLQQHHQHTQTLLQSQPQ